jgi:hypothetical protein
VLPYFGRLKNQSKYVTCVHNKYLEMIIVSTTASMHMTTFNIMDFFSTAERTEEIPEETPSDFAMLAASAPNHDLLTMVIEEPIPTSNNSTPGSIRETLPSRTPPDSGPPGLKVRIVEKNTSHSTSIAKLWTQAAANVSTNMVTG